MSKVKYRKIMIAALVLFAISIVIAEARRGFSSSGSGGGAYDSTAPTSSWDFDATLDADCQAIYDENCDALTAAQFENVQTQYDAAQAAGYASYSDYMMAAARGYALTQIDASLWAQARAQTGAFAQDCQRALGAVAGLETLLGGCADSAYADFVMIIGASGRDYVISLGYASYADYRAAAANDKGYAKSTADARLWGFANDGSVAIADCRAAVAAATSAPDINLDESTASCAQLSKIGFQNLWETMTASDFDTQLAATKTSIINGTLSVEDLTTLEIDFLDSALTETILQWQLDYLETILLTTSTASIDDWQNEIDDYDTSTASRWLIGGLADGTQLDLSLAGISLFVDAGVSLDFLQLLGLTDDDIRDGIVGSGLPAGATTSVLTNWLTILAGFASTESFEAWQAAGHDASSFPIAEWQQCYDSALTQVNQCSLTLAQWMLLYAVAEGLEITNALLIAFFQGEGVYNTAFVSPELASLTEVEGDFLRLCVRQNDKVIGMKRCASTGVARTDSFNSFILKQIYIGAYGEERFTLELLENLGLFENDANAKQVFAGDYCKAEGISSNSCMVHARKILDITIEQGTEIMFGDVPNLRKAMCAKMSVAYWDKTKTLSLDKHYVVESCQKAVFAGELAQMKNALYTPTMTTLYQTDMGELDGTYQAGVTRFSLAYNRFEGGDLVFNVPGNVVRRQQNRARAMARFEDGACIKHKKTTWPYTYVVSIMENQPDAASNSEKAAFVSSETDFNNRAYTCNVCQGSSAPSWCYDYDISIVTTMVDGDCVCANGKYNDSKGCSGDTSAQSLPKKYRYTNSGNQPANLNPLTFTNICP